MMMHTPSPDNTQQIFEQGEAALLNMARVLGSYYAELLKQGFTPAQAMVIVSEYHQSVLLRSIQTPPRDGTEKE